MILEHFKSPWDFELLDSGHGYRLEKWGKYTLKRPDPQAIWNPHLPVTEWQKADAVFSKNWEHKSKFPNDWVVNWKDIKLLAKLTPFKHTGIFAEQSSNWEWMLDRLKSKEQKLKILNLFGYTGAASVILAKAGAFVTHVDASKPSIAWAKQNQQLNGLKADSIRWILDDAVKFVQREIKRGQTYDAIIMDPPAFGHSPSGKTWKFSEDFPKLLENAGHLLSKNASFLLVNAYATNSSSLAIKNLLEDKIKLPGTIDAGELCLKQKDGRLLSTGIIGRWQKS